MKKIVLLYILFLNFVSINYSQPPTIQWKKILGGTNNDFTRNIIQTADGGYLTAASVLSNDGDITGNHGSFDFWVVKMDMTGTVEWQKVIGGTGYDFAYSAIQTLDGGYAIAGWSDSNDGDISGNHGDVDFCLIKLNSTGNIQWQKSYGGTAQDFAYSVYQCTDSTYVIAGKTYSSNGDVTSKKGGHDFWLVKTDKNGDLIWQKTYGGTLNDQAYSVKQTNFDGGYIIAGSTLSNNGDVTGNHGMEDFWIIKTDGLGNIQWAKTLGGTTNDYARDVYQTGDLGYAIIGSTESTDGDITTSYGFTDCWVIKLDANGTLQWQKNIGAAKNDFGNAIQQTSDNGYILAGWSDSAASHQGGSDYWAVKLDPSGNKTWEQCYGGTLSDFGFALDITSDGGFVISGNTSSNNGDVTGNHSALADVWIIKYNGLPLTIDNDHALSLLVYPNPSTGNFMFKNIPENSNIEVYDITGRLITELSSTQNNTAEIDITQTADGIYFYRINNPSFSQPISGKIVKQ